MPVVGGFTPTPFLIQTFRPKKKWEKDTPKHELHKKAKVRWWAGPWATTYTDMLCLFCQYKV